VPALSLLRLIYTRILDVRRISPLPSERACIPKDVCIDQRLREEVEMRRWNFLMEDYTLARVLPPTDDRVSLAKKLSKCTTTFTRFNGIDHFQGFGIDHRHRAVKPISHIHMPVIGVRVDPFGFITHFN
jgi:hypothetical protein